MPQCHRPSSSLWRWLLSSLAHVMLVSPPSIIFPVWIWCSSPYWLACRFSSTAVYSPSYCKSLEPSPRIHSCESPELHGCHCRFVRFLSNSGQQEQVRPFDSIRRPRSPAEASPQLDLGTNARSSSSSGKLMFIPILYVAKGSSRTWSSL